MSKTQSNGDETQVVVKVCHLGQMIHLTNMFTAKMPWKWNRTQGTYPFSQTLLKDIPFTDSRNHGHHLLRKN